MKQLTHTYKRGSCVEIGSIDKGEFLTQVYNQQVQTVNNNLDHPGAKSQKEKLSKFREDNPDLFNTPLKGGFINKTRNNHGN